MSDKPVEIDFVIEYISNEKRGPGWYWWPNAIGEQEQMRIGPFVSERAAHYDIFLAGSESDGY